MNIRELEILLARGEAGDMLVKLFDELDRVRAERDALRRALEVQAADLDACERAEYSLEDQAQLLDLIREAIVVHDVETGRIAFWNPGAENLYGWSSAEVVGRDADALLQTRYPVPLETIQATLTREGVWEGELTHTRRDGETLVVASRWTLKYDDDGHPAAVVETNVDVTARKQEEICRQRLMDERIEALEQTDRMKDQFLSILSHELRTPINAIMGFGSIVQDELAGPLTPQQHQYLEKILCNSDRLLRLVDDLLVLSRAIAGKLLLEPQAVPLAEAAERALEVIRSDAVDKGMRLEVDLPADMPPVWADPPRLHQMLSHLLENALKFTPEGGRIRLTAEAEGDAVRISVKDTGPGVPTEAVPRLFQTFTQLDMSATRPVGGTGVGLSLVKVLAEAQGGQVGYTPAPEGGACFWFILPQARAGSPG